MGIYLLLSKNGDAECKDVEWKRRMQFVLDQLKLGKTLTTRWVVIFSC